jgi:hypothetical protein
VVKSRVSSCRRYLRFRIPYTRDKRAFTRHQIRLDLEARNARHTHLSDDGLTIHQTLIDLNDLNDWSLHLTLDLEKSNEARTPVLHLESISPI